MTLQICHSGVVAKSGLDWMKQNMSMKGLWWSPQALSVTTLTHKHSVNEDAYDVILNPAKSQLVVKTEDKSAPIKVYDLKGNKLTQFGGDIDGLSGWGCMSLDSHRDLYLAACGGHLATVTMDGQRKERKPLNCCDLKGVAYIRDNGDPENDLHVYVVSDIENHTISVINLSVVTSFGSEGHGAGQFDYPHFITSCTYQDKPVIVVSDRNNHRVQLLDLYGKHLHTYGSHGEGDGQLHGPCGIIVDPTGRIIICDRYNNRVVSFWMEDGQDNWSCLIPQEQRLNEPYCIDIDTAGKTLDVGDYDKVHLYSYK